MQYDVLCNSSGCFKYLKQAMRFILARYVSMPGERVRLGSHFAGRVFDMLFVQYSKLQQSWFRKRYCIPCCFSLITYLCVLVALGLITYTGTQHSGPTGFTVATALAQNAARLDPRDKEVVLPQAWARHRELTLPLQCRLVHSVAEQCAFVRANCPDEEAGLFSYLQLYYCGLPHAKPFAFVILVTWLGLLFSTIGITASDYFCVGYIYLWFVWILSDTGRSTSVPLLLCWVWARVWLA